MTQIRRRLLRRRTERHLWIEALPGGPRISRSSIRNVALVAPVRAIPGISGWPASGSWTYESVANGSRTWRLRVQ
jgi:hypothetical protein